MKFTNVYKSSKSLHHIKKGVFLYAYFRASLPSQVNTNWQTYIMIAIYFIILLIIGYYGYKQATGNLSEYMLGGRSIGPYITALSACIRYEWLDDNGTTWFCL